MKPIVVGSILLAMLGGAAAAGERPRSTLTVTSSGRTAESLADSRELAVKFWVQQLLLSALYRNDASDASAGDWERAATSPTRVHWSYPAKTYLGLPERTLLTLDEVVVPIPQEGYPASIYVKHGHTFSRLEKYDPWIYWKLKVEAGIADQIPDAIPRTLF